MTQPVRDKPPVIVPPGAFAYPLRSDKPTRWFGFQLFRGFTLLAVSGAVEPLRIANQLAQKPLYGWIIASEDGRPVRASCGLQVGVDARLADIDPETYLFVCSGIQGNDAASSQALAQLRRHDRHGGEYGAICTGAATLARAGLIKDRRFTLHWENQPGFIERFPDLAPSRNRFEIDGTMMTSGGGQGATEMMLAVIREDHGRDFAIAVADMCLTDPEVASRRMQRSSIASALSSRNPKLLAAVQLMYQNIEEPLALDRIAELSGASRRQLERLFTNLMGAPPARIYRNIRLERARSLLVETDVSVLDVAISCGFTGSSNFSRSFRAFFGESPQGIRKTARH